MKVIVCIDKKGGMLFQKRRQSKDQKVLEDIAGLTDTLYINSFSSRLFAEAQVNLQTISDENFLEIAEKGEYCFVENVALMPYISKIEELIVYCWNRKYPFDFQLDIPYKTWEKVEKTEFAGSSHEQITKERYRL